MTCRVIKKDMILVGILMIGWLAFISLLVGTGIRESIQDFPKRLLLANILLVMGRHFFRSQSLYGQLAGILGGIGISILILGGILHISMNREIVTNSLIVLIAVSEIILLIPNCVEGKWLRLLLGIPLWGLFLFIAGAFWVYYLAEGGWFSAEAVLAIMQTNPGEAADYIQMHDAWLGMTLLVLLLIVLGCLCYQVARKGGLRKLGKKTGCLLAALILWNLVIAGSLSAVTYFIMPFVNAYRGLEEYNAFREAREMRRAAINPADIFSDEESGIYVLVLGESETREHMSVYGYAKPTTPWLTAMADRKDGILFARAYSCHTHTVPVWVYALTEKNQYNEREQSGAASLVEIARAAAYQVVWLSNQVHYGAWDTPTSVIADAADQQIFLNSNVGETTATDYFDGALADAVDRARIKDKTLLIIHLMGCHGAYQNRYPAGMKKFSGIDDTAYYDNAVSYNDFVLESLYNKIKELPNFQGMVYLSDHGEAVEEKLGHNSDRFVPVMAKIPLYMVFSPTYREKHHDRYQNLLAAKDKVFTNDLLYDTMLGIMGIHYNGHEEPQNDLSNAAYDGNTDRFRTLYGKVRIKDLEENQGNQ